MPARPKKAFSIGWCLPLAGIIVLCIFPPLHFRALDAAPSAASQASAGKKPLDAPAFVEMFWNDRLSKAAASATDAAILLGELRKSIPDSQKKFGHASGLGGPVYFFISGAGKIVSAASNSVAINITGGDKAEIVLQTGNVFGNAVRDGTGLLSASDYPNSREFNDIASELNLRVEKNVLPMLRQKAVEGLTVKFSGCAETSPEDTSVLPLQVIPINVEFP